MLNSQGKVQKKWQPDRKMSRSVTAQGCKTYYKTGAAHQLLDTELSHFLTYKEVNSLYFLETKHGPHIQEKPINNSK